MAVLIHRLGKLILVGKKIGKYTVSNLRERRLKDKTSRDSKLITLYELYKYIFWLSCYHFEIKTHFHINFVFSTFSSVSTTW